MDIGYFISELLAQHGNVNVPGLGYFAHTRVNAYYNDKEGVLYPPAYTVQYYPQITASNALAEYVAAKKNVSLASANYFIEKFTTGLKLQVQDGEIAIADLGWFYMDDSQLHFKPNTGINTDPDFLGYEPVKLNKLSNKKPQIVPDDYSVITEHQSTEAEPVIISEPEIQTNIEPELKDNIYADNENLDYTDTEPVKRKSPVALYVTLLVIALVIIGYLVNRYNPSIFNWGDKLKKQKADTIIKAKPVKEEDTITGKVPIDTVIINKTIPTSDTAVKTLPDQNNNLKVPRYELLGGSFSSIEEANRAIENYKKLGIEARILENVHGRKRKVTLGTFATRAEAVAAEERILSTKKVKADNMYIQPYNIK